MALSIKSELLTCGLENNVAKETSKVYVLYSILYVAHCSVGNHTYNHPTKYLSCQGTRLVKTVWVLKRDFSSYIRSLPKEPKNSAKAVGLLCSLEDGVCVQVNTAHIRRGVVQIKVAGVHSYNEWTWGAQHISQGQWAQGNIWARPVERENHLMT